MQEAIFMVIHGLVLIVKNVYQKMVEIPESKNAHIKMVMSVVIIIQLTRN